MGRGTRQFSTHYSAASRLDSSIPELGGPKATSLTETTRLGQAPMWLRDRDLPWAQGNCEWYRRWHCIHSRHVVMAPAAESASVSEGHEFLAGLITQYEVPSNLHGFARTRQQS